MMRTRLKKYLSLVALSLSSSLVQAENLLQVYELAYCNDPTLEVAKQTFYAARESLPQAAAQFLPLVSATNFHTQNYFKNDLGIVPTQRVSYFQNNYQVNLTQPIYRFDYWAQHAQACDTVKAANVTFASAEQALILRTAERYFAVLKALDNLHFIQAQRRAFARFLDQTEQRYKVGLIAITDVEIARARHDNALAQEIAAEDALANERERLREITCLKIENLALLKDKLPLAAPDGAMEQWVKKALEYNLDLQAACFTASAAKTNIKVQRAGHLPNVNLIAQYAHNSPANIQVGNINGPTSSIGLQVNIPIFNGGAVSSKVRQSVHNYLKSDGDYENRYRLVKSNTRQFYRGVLIQIEQIHALEQAVVSNEAALKATDESFSVGTRTIVDVLNAQSDLIRAQTDLVNAKYEYILQTLRLKQAAGMLCPMDIERVNSWLKTA